MRNASDSSRIREMELIGDGAGHEAWEIGLAVSAKVGSHAAASVLVQLFFGTPAERRACYAAVANAAGLDGTLSRRIPQLLGCLARDVDDLPPDIVMAVLRKCLKADRKSVLSCGEDLAHIVLGYPEILEELPQLVEDLEPPGRRIRWLVSAALHRDTEDIADAELPDHVASLAETIRLGLTGH